MAGCCCPVSLDQLDWCGVSVILRGLTVNHQGGVGGGIAFNTGGTLHIENCAVAGFLSSAGVVFIGAGTLEVKDSIMTGNSTGIVIDPSSGTAVATIDHVRLEGSTHDGLDVESGSKVTIRNSMAFGNGTGFLVLTGSAVASELNVENCVASNNNVGIEAAEVFGAVTVRVSNSTVTGNLTGLSALGTMPSLLSRGNNTVEGNGNEGSFTGTYIPK